MEKIKNIIKNTIILKIREAKNESDFRKAESKSFLTDCQRTKIVKNDVSRETF